MTWNGNKEWKRARRLSGLARYERECCPRRQRAGWRVYGTFEYAQREVYARIAADIYNARRKAQDAQAST